MLAYVDSSVWIACTEGRPEFRNIIKSQLRELKQEGWRFCTSKAVIMETLYKPYRENNHALVTVYTKIFGKTKMLPNYPNLFTDAMQIMRTEILRAMDSIHVAHAAHYRCKRFITTDADFRNLKILSSHWIDLSQVTHS